MITLVYPQDTSTYEYRGLSTDVKPTDCPNGSIFYEMDTQKAFLYNLDSTTWIEQ